jgi:hypothetical protein
VGLDVVHTVGEDTLLMLLEWVSAVGMRLKVSLAVLTPACAVAALPEIGARWLVLAAVAASGQFFATWAPAGLQGNPHQFFTSQHDLHGLHLAALPSHSLFKRDDIIGMRRATNHTLAGSDDTRTCTPQNQHAQQFCFICSQWPGEVIVIPDDHAGSMARPGAPGVQTAAAKIDLQFLKNRCATWLG